MLNYQNFPYQNFALKNFWYCGYNFFKLEFVRVSLIMSGLVILIFEVHFHLILDKNDSPEDEELYSICLGHYQRLYPSSLVATELYINTEVTKIKMVCYQKWLTLAQRHEIGKKGAEIGVMLAISQPRNQVNMWQHDKYAIIYF